MINIGIQRLWQISKDYVMIYLVVLFFMLYMPFHDYAYVLEIVTDRCHQHMHQIYDVIIIDYIILQVVSTCRAYFLIYVAICIVVLILMLPMSIIRLTFHDHACVL